MAPDAFIFANPIAGRGKGRTTAERIARRLTADGYRPRIVLERVDQADIGGVEVARVVVAIGGDGTLRGVVHQVLKHGAAPPVLLIPFGTANLMAQHLSLKWNDARLEDEVSSVVRGGKVVRVDAATANGTLFLLMAGIGIDARVVHELDKLRSGPIRLASYAIPAALALSFYRYPAITVTVDGRTLHADAPAIAMVGNVPEYGTRFPILPMARPDDGVLDVCVMPCASPQDLLKLFLHAAAGEHLTLEGVTYAKGKSIRVTSEAKVPVQVDGDAAGFTPLAIEMASERVGFLVG